MVWQLRAHGHEVVVLLRPTSDRSRIDAAEPTVAIGDITDPASLRTAMKGVDAVFHLSLIHI